MASCSPISALSLGSRTQGALIPTLSNSNLLSSQVVITSLKQGCGEGREAWGGGRRV